MPGCITGDYRAILKNLVDGGADKVVVSGVLSGIPECPELKAAKEGAEREGAKPWGVPVTYIDAKGKKEDAGSLSGLVKDKGLPMSGIQCDASGKKCNAASAADILRIHGFTVLQSGKEIGLPGNPGKKKFEGGTEIFVYDPKAPNNPLKPKAAAAAAPVAAAKPAGK